MSHFSMLVLVRGGTDGDPLDREDAQGMVQDLLQRYDENAPVPEYARPCYCVGHVASGRCKDAVVASLQEKFPAVARAAQIPEEIPDEAELTPEMRAAMPKPGPATLRDYLMAECDRICPVTDTNDGSEGERQVVWERLVEELYEAPLRALMAVDPDRETPDSECEYCGGSGTEMTTSNPEGYWDWWQIGGSWSGCLTSVDPEDNPANWETCFVCAGTGKRDDELGQRERERDPAYTCNGCNGTGKTLKFSLEEYDGDVLPVALLDRSKVVGRCYGYVDPEGEWHAQGEMGWFGMERTKERTKDELALALNGALDVYHDCYAVMVDCHV